MKCAGDAAGRESTRYEESIEVGTGLIRNVSFWVWTHSLATLTTKKKIDAGNINTVSPVIRTASNVRIGYVIQIVNSIYNVETTFAWRSGFSPVKVIGQIGSASQRLFRHVFGKAT